MPLLLSFLSSLIKLILWLKTWFSSKESACQSRRCGFNPWVRKIPWRKGSGNPPQYSCLEISHEQRSLAGYSPWSRKELDTTEHLQQTKDSWRTWGERTTGYCSISLVHCLVLYILIFLRKYHVSDRKQPRLYIKLLLNFFHRF